MRRAACGVLAAVALLAVACGSASAAARPCPREKGFLCETVTVPLDHTGAVPGTIPLHYAVQPGRRTGVLLALTGGPGQNGIPFGGGFADQLAPALRDHRLLVMDQRGTGRSHVLDCPEAQGLNGLQTYFPETAASCARRLGPQRDHFSTADTADDIEAIRQRLGVDKIEIYGVSYGTWVAQQYARRYPAHVERLILDSVVPPDDDPYDLRVTEAIPRVLRGLCAHGACRGITTDPFADLTAVVQRIQTQGNLHGVVRDLGGGRREVTFSQFDMLAMLVGTDLNPWMRLRLPGALAAARAGDVVPLLRLRRDAAGPPMGLGDLSAGLFIATTCSDTPLPYSLSEPVGGRAAKAAAALAALPAQAFAPFDRPTVDRSSAPQICLQWPPAPPAAAPAGPLPDVPTLILSGRDDLRTPLEGARTVAAQLPHSTLVAVVGSGHDVLGSDETGCVTTALARFTRGRTVGTPCRGRTDEMDLAPVPPRSLGDVPRAAGVAGDRGRVAYAAVATVGDARTSANEALYAGWNDPAGAGLRAGHFDIVPTGIGDVLAFHDVVYVPGVRVRGAVFSSQGVFTGRLDVTGPHGMSGTLILDRGRLHGRLGGRRIRVSANALKRARVARDTPGVRAVIPAPLPGY